MEEIKLQVRQALLEVLKAADLKENDLFVVGCSSSENALLGALSPLTLISHDLLQVFYSNRVNVLHPNCMAIAVFQLPGAAQQPGGLGEHDRLSRVKPLLHAAALAGEA